MVKKYIKIIVFFSFSCCCYNGKLTEYGHARIEKFKPYTKTEIDANIYSDIDTLSIYEHIYDIYAGKIYERDSLIGREFLRFYSMGKASSFISVGYDQTQFRNIPNYEINKDDFNPLKSRQGYYYQKKNKLYLNHLIVRQCGVTGYLSEIIVKKDTIILIPEELIIKHVYVKRNIPKDFLEGWKPDW